MSERTGPCAGSRVKLHRLGPTDGRSHKTDRRSHKTDGRSQRFGTHYATTRHAFAGTRRAPRSSSARLRTDRARHRRLQHTLAHDSGLASTLGRYPCAPLNLACALAWHPVASTEPGIHACPASLRRNEARTDISAARPRKDSALSHRQRAPPRRWRACDCTHAAGDRHRQRAPSHRQSTLPSPPGRVFARRGIRTHNDVATCRTAEARSCTARDPHRHLPGALAQSVTLALAFQRHACAMAELELAPRWPRHLATRAWTRVARPRADGML